MVVARRIILTIFVAAAAPSTAAIRTVGSLTNTLRAGQTIVAAASYCRRGGQALRSGVAGFDGRWFLDRRGEGNGGDRDPER
jgi:hypothetical protein